METLDEKKFKNFISAERKFLNESKYYKGINTHKDPGDEYVIECVQKKAKTFREMWNLSVCKDCIKAANCGNNLRIDCNDFNELT
jgi:hypothetical protein